MRGPAHTRLDVDERRRRLLELGADLFTRFAYDELSMARIAKEAGISKALLYHYFPSKEAYFAATLEKAAAELQERTRPDDSKEPLEQLSNSLDAYLGAARSSTGLIKAGWSGWGGGAASPSYWTSTRSTTKISVAPGGMSAPAPWSP